MRTASGVPPVTLWQLQSSSRFVLSQAMSVYTHMNNSVTQNRVGPPSAQDQAFMPFDPPSLALRTNINPRVPVLQQEASG